MAWNDTFVDYRNFFTTSSAKYYASGSLSATRAESRAYIWNLVLDFSFVFPYKVEWATAGWPLNRSLSRRVTAGWPFNRSVEPRNLDGNRAELVASILWHVFVHLFFLLYLYFPASQGKRIEQLSSQSPNPTLSIPIGCKPRWWRVMDYYWGKRRAVRYTMKGRSRVA